MRFWIKFILFIIYFDIKIFVSEFVSIGEYPDYKDLDINLLQCGLTTVPTIYKINYPTNCYQNQYKNITFLVLDRINQTSGQNVLQRVFQGQDVQLGESPWTVLVRIPVGGTCTGVLITFQWVLTAAHCYHSYHKTRYVLSVGSDTNHFIERRYGDLKRFYRHYKYSDPPANASSEDEETKQVRYTHDIGLIKLDTPFTKHLSVGKQYLINTICLPKSEEYNTVYDNATYYGFGLVEGTSRTSNNLQKALVMLNPFGNCSLAPRMFCAYFASPGDPRPCRGDSGGPLVQQIHSERHVLIGINRGKTINTTCSTNITYAYWVAVPNFIDWILNTIREN